MARVGYTTASQQIDVFSLWFVSGHDFRSCGKTRLAHDLSEGYSFSCAVSRWKITTLHCRRHARSQAERHRKDFFRDLFQCQPHPAFVPESWNPTIWNPTIRCKSLSEERLSN